MCLGGTTNQIQRIFINCNILRYRALGTQTSTIDVTPRASRNKNLCKALYLHSHQRAVCMNYTGLIPSVAEGIRLSIDECQEQFKNRKWNCSISEAGNSVFWFYDTHR